jgi:GNAT superfamily N-acetyltransferase
MQQPVTIDPGPAREVWRDLLALADEPAPLSRVLHAGTLYGVHTDDGRPGAAVLVLDRGDGLAELRAVAVAEPLQGRGLGSWIVRRVCERLQAAGHRRVLVGTASSGPRQLAFYLRLGFRALRVERDHFGPANGYPEGLTDAGIPTRDMIWLDLDL